MTNWLITGGCGFIGTQLIRTLSQDSTNNLCVVDNLSVGNKAALEAAYGSQAVDRSASDTDFFATDGSTAQCVLVRADIHDADVALKVCQQADVIVHLAANTGVHPSVLDPRLDCSTNVTGTLNYLEGARHSRGKRFVFASSGAPVGEVKTLPIHEELPVNPVSPYGASKLAGEGYCSAYHQTFEVDTVALRFGNVYGPGSVNKSSVVAKFIRHALADEPLEIYGNGKQTRDFIYVEDLVNAITLAATTPGVGGHKFQIATNRESTVAEVAEMITAILRDLGVSNIEIQYQGARLGDVMRNYSDVSKAADLLGWEPQHDLQSGLEKTIKYFYDEHRG
jgi:UDP-glucose 4-epimerase